jgi:hypothetical protein
MLSTLHLLEVIGRTCCGIGAEFGDEGIYATSLIGLIDVAHGGGAMLGDRKSVRMLECGSNTGDFFVVPKWTLSLRVGWQKGLASISEGTPMRICDCVTGCLW